MLGSPPTGPVSFAGFVNGRRAALATGAKPSSATTAQTNVIRTRIANAPAAYDIDRIACRFCEAPLRASKCTPAGRARGR
jgi:hypothetical protein